MSITSRDAVASARALLGTPYAELDCIGLIVRVIRTAPGGVPGYRTAGTNTLWRSYESAARYRDLVWRQEGLSGAKAGMLAFKRNGEDVHHVGLVTGEGTVIHASSAKGRVVETELGGAWQLLAVHRHIAVAADGASAGRELYRARVNTRRDPLRVREAPGDGRVVGHIPRGAVARVIEDAGNGWLRIQYNGIVGYASDAYMTIQEG